MIIKGMLNDKAARYKEGDLVNVQTLSDYKITGTVVKLNPNQKSIVVEDDIHKEDIEVKHILYIDKAI